MRVLCYSVQCLLQYSFQVFILPKDNADVPSHANRHDPGLTLHVQRILSLSWQKNREKMWKGLAVRPFIIFAPNWIHEKSNINSDWLRTSCVISRYRPCSHPDTDDFRELTLNLDMLVMFSSSVRIWKEVYRINYTNTSVLSVFKKMRSC